MYCTLLGCNEKCSSKKEEIVQKRHYKYFKDTNSKVITNSLSISSLNIILISYQPFSSIKLSYDFCGTTFL